MDNNSCKLCAFAIYQYQIGIYLYIKVEFIIYLFISLQLMQLDSSKTLAELKLCPQETLMLEPRSHS